MAENEAGTQAERRLQYERVINILKRLEQPIKFKPEAIAAIEAAAGITLELTSTPHLQDA